MRGLNYPTYDEMGYSTSEVETGLTWIDGSTIYKKTINCGALPNNGTKQVASNINNLSRVIQFSGWAYRPSDAVMFTLPYVSGTAAFNIVVSIHVSFGIIEITTGSDRSNVTESYITLYYTKVAAS